MIQAMLHGFFDGLGFCLAIALVVGFTELKQFAKKNYDSNILGAWKRHQDAKVVEQPKPTVSDASAPVAPAPVTNAITESNPATVTDTTAI